MLLVILVIFALFVAMHHGHFLRQAQSAPQTPYETRLKLWQRHERLNGTLWLLLFFFIVTAEFFFLRGQVAQYPSIGVLLLVFGLILVVWSRLILGRAGAMGIRWFLPEKVSAWETRGPYHMFANPMYDGFILIFLGIGFWLGTVENFILAIASLLLLNVYLARIENKGHGGRIF